MQLLRGRTSGITILAISPDSRYVVAASASEFAQCHVWDLSDAKPKQRKLSPDGSLSSITFSSLTTLDAIVGDEWWRYDLATGTQVQVAFSVEVQLAGAILRPSGELLKASDPDWRVLTVRVADDGVEVIGCGTPAPIYLITFDPTGGRYLAEHLDTHEGAVYHLRDAATDQIVTTFDLPERSGRRDLHFYVFTPDGEKLFVVTKHHVTIYPCPKGGPPISVFSDATIRQFDDLAVHPGGRLLATVEDERTVTLRDADTLQPLRSYDFAMPKVTCVAFTPDGTRCVIGNSRGKVLLFDVE